MLLLLWLRPKPFVITAVGKLGPPGTMPAKLREPIEMMPSELLIPVEGVTAAELVDDFNETRDGHRHEAIDIPAPRGTPVLAAAQGSVVKLFQSEAGGLTVYQFDDSERLCFYYAHLDHYVNGLSEGALLRRGQVVGYVGATGNASPNAPHLHFAVFQLGPEKHWWQGRAIDPYPLLTGRIARH